MSTTENQETCREVEEELASILDGSASARLYDHVAECDACRDLKHEASLAAERVRDAGADFRPEDDFVEKLVARLDAARPASSGPAVKPSRPEGAASAGSVVVRAAYDPPTDGTAPTRLATDVAATVLDPLAALKVAEAEAESSPDGKTDVTLHSARAGAAAPAGATREEAPSPLALEAGPAASTPAASTPAASGVSATTHHGPTTEPKAAEAKPGSYRTPAERQPDGKPGRTIEQGPAADLLAKRAAPPPAARAKRSLYRRPAFLACAAGAMAAAAAVGFYLKGKGTTDATAVAVPWSGNVANVARASADKSGGLEACDGPKACAPVTGGAALRAGTTLRTDARTRAHVTLADGTELAIDRASEVELSKDRNRAARVVRGTIVADVAHVEGSSARIAFPHGEIEVIGTKLAVTAGEDRASVEVARGNVRVHTDGGKTVDVRAGEEAVVVGSGEPVVSSSASLADMMEWSDDKPEEVDSPVLRGLGELRARKPGQTAEKGRAVRLSKHGVKVRVVDVVARTEVDETFTNDTDEELEGIFRFPLPPGAQIERLALEVDGKLVDGAFVDRDKGAAIWRGVIQNAAPKAPKPQEELIWVPGPWRDPALLEWQRGGRFELKIFPIPKRGSRRVVLAYTQVVEQSAGLRRFVYPLAHDPSGSTKIGAFDLDVQVLGLDRSVGLATRGYDLASAQGEGERRTMHADDFVPAGDLTVEYALPDRDKEVTTWAYTMPPQASGGPSDAPARPASTATGPAAPKTAQEKEADAAARAVVDDASPYVAIALRPRLPRWQEAKERLHVIVVDSSRSMFGERFARATHLASGIVREMDRRDSFVLLACDTVCRAMGGDAGGGPVKPEAPGAAAAGEVERFLGTTEPEGGSDLAAAMSAARAAAGPLDGKELRILYLGDGTPTVGPTRPSHLEAAVRGVITPDHTAVVAVPLGADADTTSLAALARGGGGMVVPYVPGQKVSTAALEVLGAAYGVALRDPEVELPSGLSQVTPARLDPIRAGGETLLVARMSPGADVSGTLKLRGRVAGERFEQSYPIKIVPSTSAGNAFVPRLYAAAKIAELEQNGGDAQKASAIALSRRFAVASRFTSLLVLESPAMFKAFGLERTAGVPAFTGEQQAESSTADGENEAQKDEAAAAAGDDNLGRLAGPSPAATAAPIGGGGRAAPARPSLLRSYDGSDLDGAMDRGPGGPAPGVPRPAEHAASKAADRESPYMDAPPAAAAAPAPPPMAPMQPAAPVAAPAPPPPPAKVAVNPFDKKEVAGEAKRKAPAPTGGPVFDSPFRRQRFVPMRKVFERHVAFDAANAFAAQNGPKLPAAESALAASPDSRDKTVELFALYATTGRVGEAQELTAKWAGRDALDPDALLARADLAARQGDRDRAIRILGGLADLRPNDRAVQTRLAEMHEAAGDAAQACEHRLAIADMAPGEAKLVAAAIRCARAQGMSDLASVLRFDAAEKVRDAIDKLLAGPAPAASGPRGDVQLSATWSGGADLDLALIDAQGRRTSWLGSAGKATVTARDVKSTRDESLDVSGLPSGNYVVEVSRASGRDAAGTISGELTLRLNGETRRVPFSLTGPRTEIGTVRVFFTSHLEPVTGALGGGWRR
jgi:hypothetical protein